MLEINNLNKSFGKVKILKNININFKGGILGLLGPNGAGKTTLMKCIVSIHDYEGKILLNGKDIKEVSIGYLPQKFSFLSNLTVKEAIEYGFLLKNLKIDDSVFNLIERVNLVNEKDKLIKNLSGGMLRRLGIAISMVGNPELIVIDEPTVGLDIAERSAFRELLQSLSEQTNIIISTHIVEDIEDIANEIVIIKNGELLVENSLTNLVNNLKGKIKLLDDEDIVIDNKNYYVLSTFKNPINGQKVKKILLLDEDIESTYDKKLKDTVITLEDIYFYYTR